MSVNNNYQANFAAKYDPISVAVKEIKKQAHLARKSGASFYQDSVEIPIKHKVLDSVTLYVTRLDEAKVSIQLFFSGRLGKLTNDKASMVQVTKRVEDILNTALVKKIQGVIEKYKMTLQN